MWCDAVRCIMVQLCVERAMCIKQLTTWQEWNWSWFIILGFILDILLVFDRIKRRKKNKSNFLSLLTARCSLHTSNLIVLRDFLYLTFWWQTILKSGHIQNQISNRNTSTRSISLCFYLIVLLIWSSHDPDSIALNIKYKAMNMFWF